MSAAPDNPRRRSILKYQIDLVKIAKKSGVGNVLVIGPSDALPMVYPRTQTLSKRSAPDPSRAQRRKF